ncbi:MAG TPA: DUF748 domain-containing protein [Bacteriovoracaceae bacterium]|nr:DUF748 domain-containing protein [Bacteriovoracaceae bacterium]
MKSFKQGPRPLYRKKRFIIPVSLFALLLVARMIAEPIILKNANKFLATFSPEMSFHIDDLDFRFIRGAYGFTGITGKLKENGKEFMNLKDLDVSMAWREIFKGRIVADVVVADLDFSYSQGLKAAADKMTNKGDQKQAKEKLIPFKVERVDIKDSKVTLNDYRGLKEGEKFKITDITGTMTNLTPNEKFPLSFFNVHASVMGSSNVKSTGNLNILAKPPKWDVDGELLNFDLTSANQFLKNKVPLTFTKGKLDVYAEAKSEKGKVEGYIKPFMKNLDIMKSEESFKGIKHWGIEVLTALGNLVLRASDTKSVATKIPFSYDGELKVDSGEALSKAIQHGFEQKLSPGIENRYELE